MPIRLVVAVVLGTLVGCAQTQDPAPVEVHTPDDSRTWYYEGLTLKCNLETGFGVLHFEGEEILAECRRAGLVYRWDWNWMEDRGAYRYSVIAKDAAAHFFDFSHDDKTETDRVFIKPFGSW